CSTASRRDGPGRPAQAPSSDVFPLPAGAEMTVTFRVAARSRAATRSPRSISRGAAGATVKGLPWYLRLTPLAPVTQSGTFCLGTRPARVLSTAREPSLLHSHAHAVAVP